MRLLLALTALLWASPVAAQATYPPVDTQARADAAAARAAADSSVKTVNGQSGNVTIAVPTASTVTPPSVADSSVTGTMTTMYALANHTHASKARKGRVLVPVAGFTDVTFTTPFTAAPLCVTTAETTAGDTNVVNSQIDGVTTPTGFRMRVTRTAITVASLLGLSILSVPTQVATYAHYVCIEP